MFFHLDLLGRDDSLDDTLLVDDESGAERTEIFAAVHTLLTPNAELFYQLLAGVGDKWEGQLVFIDELMVRFLVVDAYAHHGISLFAQLRIVVAQVASFGRAA